MIYGETLTEERIMKKLTLASIISSILATTAIAAPQDMDNKQAPTPADSTFATLDKDEDGFISQGEASKDNVWNYFVKVDEDADGQLSPNEFNTYVSMYGDADMDNAETENSDPENALDDSDMDDSDMDASDMDDSDMDASDMDDSDMDASDMDDSDMDASDMDDSDMDASDMDDSGMDDAKMNAEETESAVEHELSQAKQDAISAKAQNSNAMAEKQLTQHDNHDDVNANTTLDDPMKDAESNAQNALDNAKELAIQEQDTLKQAHESKKAQMSEQGNNAKHKMTESSDEKINSDLEQDNPALKAPEQPAPIKQEFAEVDVNADGFISREEAKNSEIAEHFDNADIDSDDKISQQEYDTFVKGQQLTARYSVRFPYESE